MKARLPKGMGGGPQNMQAMLKQAQQKRQSLRKKNMSFLPAAAW